MTASHPSSSSTAGLLRVLRDLFRGGERWRLAVVFAVTAGAALLETIGVAIVFPFMTFVVDPAAVERYPQLMAVVPAAAAASERDLLLWFGGLTIGLLALGNAAGALNVIVQERFAARTRTRLLTSLFRGYLAQPYAFHVERAAPSLIKVLTVDISVVMTGVITPFLVAVSRCCVVVGITLLLLIQQPVVAATVLVVLGVSYGVVFLIVGFWQRRLGQRFDGLTLVRQQVAHETLAGVKELQLLGREAHALQTFAAAARGAAYAEAATRAVAQMPRFILETLAFGGILGVMLSMISTAGRATEAVPVLALFAVAGHRLLPALQAIYASALSIRFYLPTCVDGLYHDYVLVGASRPPLEPEDAPLHFADAIRLDGLTFTYDGAAVPALHDVTLAIGRNTSVGFVGRTGSGKTTLADLILGFYTPSEGRITVDGVPLTGANLRSWRRRVGYVPQAVFLANASVASNIAFGLPSELVDQEAVRRAARLAQVDEFISGLPDGFDTLVGERGVRLSGGQRQRIGIARALYNEPELLVFDEATSALDGLTEEAVMEAIRSLRGERTVILIAHRLSTVQACDEIVMLDRGRIESRGTYEELIATSPAFAEFVGAAAVQASAVQA